MGSPPPGPLSNPLVAGAALAAAVLVLGLAYLALIAIRNRKE